MSVGVVHRGLIARDAETVVFIHGWPDTDLVFDAQYDALKDHYRLVSLILPGYRKEKLPFFGMELPELIDRLADAIRSAMDGYAGQPFLVAHDWGAFLGNEIAHAHPDLFSKVVLLDVGCHIGRLSLKASLILITYQWLLAFFYFLPQWLGTPLSKGMARLLGAPHQRAVHSGMDYLYVQFWKHTLLSPTPSMKRFVVPKVPTLFLYGTQKPLRFHSQRFLQYLDDTEGCQQRGFTEGHWFFRAERLVDEVNDVILGFFESP